jgi:hypothetical protein
MEKRGSFCGNDPAKQLAGTYPDRPPRVAPSGPGPKSRPDTEMSDAAEWAGPLGRWTRLDQTSVALRYRLFILSGLLLPRNNGVWKTGAHFVDDCWKLLQSFHWLEVLANFKFRKISRSEKCT